MAQWQPYVEARRTVPALAGATVGGGSNPVRAVVGEGQAQCSQCGHRGCPPTRSSSVDGLPVCANCKPLLLQRLSEGVPVRSALLGAATYAGFWIRVGAAILDSLILIPFYIVLLRLPVVFHRPAQPRFHHARGPAGTDRGKFTRQHAADQPRSPSACWPATARFAVQSVRRHPGQAHLQAARRCAAARGASACRFCAAWVVSPPRWCPVHLAFAAA